MNGAETGNKCPETQRNLKQLSSHPIDFATHFSIGYIVILQSNESFSEIYWLNMVLAIPLRYLVYFRFAWGGGSHITLLLLLSLLLLLLVSFFALGYHSDIWLLRRKRQRVSLPNVCFSIWVFSFWLLSDWMKFMAE